MENVPEPGNHAAPVTRRSLIPVLRIVLYLLAVGAALLFLSILLLPVLIYGGFRPDRGFGPDIPLWQLTISSAPFAVAVVLVTLGFVVFVDRRPAETLGFARCGSWSAEIRLGVGLGLGLPFLMFAISYLAGWTKLAGSLFSEPPAHVFAVLMQSLVLMAAVAVGEETMVRGYILQTLRWGYGVFPALLASSVVFGLGHFMNPGAAFPGFLGTTAAGLVLGYCYLATRRLWLPTAFHFAWNFALGPVFGFRVSGVAIRGWMDQELIGPSLWTGGEFGPEAGLLGMIVWLVGVPVIWWFAKHLYRPGSSGPVERATGADEAD